MDKKELSSKDYSDTVNLPNTDFQMKANLPAKEPQFIERWNKNNLYEKMRAKNANSKNKYIFHDGPPYANGHIHLGHALNRSLKDFVVKYKTMSGFDVPFTPGWDCHGLPIEQQCLKALKTDKNKVDKTVFRAQAKDFALKFVDIQREEFKRLGVLADWQNPYLTLEPKYESSMIKVFADLAEKGYIYRKKKPVYWCMTCETALADAEVDYAPHVSESVFVKFQSQAEPNVSVLVWTTTPWTLPSNVALAFNPEADYIIAKVKLENGDEHNLIFAKALTEKVKEILAAEIIEESKPKKGKSLEHKKFTNPVTGKTSVGILAEFVTLEDGTGIVHIAPGHGVEDYQAGLEYNLEIISPLNNRGQYTAEVEKYQGMKVFDANKAIIEDLLKDGTLLSSKKLDHSYPHCWRCKKPVIYRATPQWFLNVDHENLREKMQSEISKTKWVPKYGENRILGMIQNRPDWCLSRQRLWGVPLPIFYCAECQEPILDKNLIYKIAELFAQKGAAVWWELTAEELLKGSDIKCSCGHTTFTKEEDILDVWFESGVSFEAVLASGNYSGLTYPADLYLEGSDQHRGWFQTSLINSTAVKDQAPFKTVLTHGFVVDGQGKKMSKSVGNVTAPETFINKYGADILRLWVASADYKEDIRVSEEIIKGLSDSYRKIRNTVRFLLGNINGFSPSKKLEFEDMQEIDKYALSRLSTLVAQVHTAYEAFEFHKVASAVNVFCSVFLSGFYLDALKDVLYCDRPTSKTRVSAQSAMFEICKTLVKIVAPILSFTSEEAWDEFLKLDPSLEESVFLTNFPQASYSLDEKLKEKWESLVKIKEASLNAFENVRQQKIIGSNMEAHAVVKHGKNYADAVKNTALLSQVLGTWDIALEALNDADALEIEVKQKSALLKCARCWRHIEGVNESELCPRCQDAISAQ
ncbi:MAG: isoleucine--tRNA ligase [Elusimicrobia bacterium]|nr:isoleucine--tRNA ligase [Elusimicrobiota bacterium]